jgi:hypothetical protein
VLGAANIEFTSIPATYTDLKVVASVRTSALTTIGNETLDLQINSLTTGYSGKQLYGGGGTATGALNRNNVVVSTIVAANDTTSAFSSVDIYLPNYAGSNQKAYSVDAVADSNSTTVYELDLTAKLNSTTSAITTLKLLCSSGNFVQYSSATLYGIKKN